MDKYIKKRVVIGLSFFIIIIIILASVLVKKVNDDRIEREKKYYEELREMYRQETYALGMKKTYGSYKDYSYVYENKLIVFLAAYNYYHPDVQISLDDVKDFLSFEFDESGKPRAFSRPDNIADYIAWFWSDDGNNQVSNYEVGLWIYMDRFSNEYQDAKIDEMDTEEMYKLIEDYNSFLSQG